MKMIMHHQKIRRDQRDKDIFIGEDARPYVDPNGKILVVADGLGGRGGYPHSKILLDDETLDEKNVYKVIFGEVFADLDSDPDEDFKDYVAKSFSEILNPPSFYIDKKRAVRTSGYYASRLVSIITIALIKYTENFNADALFEKIDKAEEDKQNIIDEYCDDLAKALREKMSKVAERIGLECESSLKGAYLLPSTLTVALVKEKKGNNLDIVYLWAGDTRGYLWNKRGGLKQITDDHEKYETMTNLITLTKDFKIEGALTSTKKPSLLFNVSDGCYKCACFASPFDLECTIIDKISQVNSFEGLSALLKDFFDRMGKHDDSNTMALYSYGFADFNAIKEAIGGRIDNLKEDFKEILDAYNRKINTKIRNKLYSKVSISFEDIKTEDYTNNKYKAEEAAINALIDNENVLKVPEIKDVVIGKMLECKYSPFVSDVTNAYDLLYSEVEAYVNPDKLSIEELAKLYWEKEGRTFTNDYKLKCSNLRDLVEKNMNIGVVFSDFKEYIDISEYEQKHPEKTDDERFVEAICDKIKRREIIIIENELVFGNMKKSIPADAISKFSDIVDYLLANKEKCNFVSKVFDLTEKHIGEFYGSKECKRNIREIFDKISDEVFSSLAEIDEKFKPIFDALMVAKNNFEARKDFYDAYYDKYDEKLAKSKLNKE